MIRLRAAAPSDRALLERWDCEPDIDRAGGEDDAYDWAYELPRALDWREIFMVERADETPPRPIGVVVVIDPAREESRYWGAIAPGFRAVDIWMGAADDRSLGFGGAAMRLVAERCFAEAGVRAILADPLVSNVRAHRFYARCGYRRVGRRLFGSDDCYVYRLNRAD